MRYLKLKGQKGSLRICGYRLGAMGVALSHGVNELNGGSQSGTLTVSGSTAEGGLFYGLSDVTNVTVNGVAAASYSFGTFAAPGFSPTNGPNTYTAVAQDSLGRASTNSITVNVMGSPSYTYDANGNLTSDGVRKSLHDSAREIFAAQRVLPEERTIGNAYRDVVPRIISRAKENQLVGVWVTNGWSNSFVYPVR